MAPESVLRVLPPALRRAVEQLPERVMGSLEEVRVRLGRPVVLLPAGEEWYLRPNGALAQEAEGALVADRDLVDRLFALVTGSSLYSLESELQNGYVTLPGGHRVGFAGEVVPSGDQIRTIKHVTSFNIRLARQIPGAADAVRPHLLGPGGRPQSVLFASPPQCGKTTILRDAVRQLADGLIGAAGRAGRGFKVAVIDERSEIAGCWRGVPQNDLGLRTDVLDKCPKAPGIMLALRALSPDVVATDEIGSQADLAALQEAKNAGVAVLATAHGETLRALGARPALSALLTEAIFDRVIFLNRRRGPGTVERVVDVGCSADPPHIPSARAISMSRTGPVAGTAAYRG